MYEGRVGLINTLFLYQAKVVTDVSVMVLMEIVIASPATTNAWAGKESTPVGQYFGVSHKLIIFKQFGGPYFEEAVRFRKIFKKFE